MKHNKLSIVLLAALVGCTQVPKKNAQIQPTVPDSKPGTLYVMEDASKVWPTPRGQPGSPGYDLCWHLDDEHTQLRYARIKVMQRMKAKGIKPVRIMTLDTGYDPNFETIRADRPADFRMKLNTKLAHNFVKGENASSAEEHLDGDIHGNFGHGTGTHRQAPR
jgi:hypothetical protein